MKKLVFLLLLFTSMVINAQVVDFSHFSKKTMNEVMFSEMNKYVKGINHGDSLTQTSLKMYRVSKRHSSPNVYGYDDWNVLCKDDYTYQEIAEIISTKKS